MWHNHLQTASDRSDVCVRRLKYTAGRKLDWPWGTEREREWESTCVLVFSEGVYWNNTQIDPHTHLIQDECIQLHKTHARTHSTNSQRLLQGVMLESLLDCKTQLLCGSMSFYVTFGWFMFVNLGVNFSCSWKNKKVAQLWYSDGISY